MRSFSLHTLCTTRESLPQLSTHSCHSELMGQSWHRIKVRLHRPLSLLHYSTAELRSACTAPACESFCQERQLLSEFHTTKVLEASKRAIGLYTLPLPRTDHSPLAICALNLCLLSQVAACRFTLKGAEYRAARDRLRFGMSTMELIGKVWPSGESTLEELRSIAAEVLDLQKELHGVSGGT